MSDKTIPGKTISSGISARKTIDLGKIKDYKILGVIGEGGMGKVYKAVHPTLKREIILKELKIRDKETRERFLREATVMLDFRHENIVQFYDHFKEGTSTYIAMEYVKGLPLNELIKQSEKIPVPLALFILYQSALGLNHAHTKKVIHRDIKPHNLLISETGDVKLIDFGIASQKNDSKECLTAPGTVIGTPAYMSPEQFSSSKEISFQSDIYSLGVVFYEMITGNKPFKNEFSSEVIDSIARGKYPPAHKIIKNLPSIAKKILSKMFNPIASKRYKTLVPLIKLLKKYFSNYNVYELKASIRCLLQNNKDITCYPFYTRHAEIIKRKSAVVKIIGIVVFLTAIVSWFYLTNSHYTLILRNSYGAVNLSFNKANLDMASTFVKIDNRFYKVVFKPKSDEYRKTFYLKKGYHEISINSGSYKITRKIDLLPITMQKKNILTKNGMNINIKVYNLSPKEVMLSLRFWDAINPDKYLFQFDNYTEVNDRLLKESDDLAIWDTYRKSNVLLRDYIHRRLSLKQSPFYSNQDYAFIVSGFEKDGIKYDNRRFKLKFALDERTVVAHIPIAPVPAKIRVISPNKKNKIIINNSDNGLLFDNDQYVGVKYNVISAKPYGKDAFIFEYLIPPGTCTFKVGRNGREINVKLLSDEIYELKLRKEKRKIVY
ncbi:MAG: hypothetical protein A2015_17260 [Spirochaetes bacterium GWF1_31_7]|nr:MAG: hypothetical protein A2Y30_10010 [Spirochaetes bacterium GWE1_32_154]OHD46504.1 MAG: hypothetical protein A2Y29_04140 [Spirochaetes bacterium GWE2_31_10]OHD46737.1 MAG: hypothetical protein A2015_17260 [Spirochaetes bacterium GWF1_31_7]